MDKLLVIADYKSNHINVSLAIFESGWNDVHYVNALPDDCDLIFQYGERFEIVLPKGTWKSGRVTIGKGGIVFYRSTDNNMTFKSWVDKNDSAQKLEAIPQIPQEESNIIEI